MKSIGEILGRIDILERVSDSGGEREERSKRRRRGMGD